MTGSHGRLPDGGWRRGVCAAAGFALALSWLALAAARVAASPEVSAPVPGSPTFTSFAAAFDNQGTTHFMVTAVSTDGSPLAYVWSTQDLSCGNLVDPLARGPQNGYYHGANSTYPNGCPFAIETQTRVSVLVVRAADVDPNGTPHDNAPYFVYSQVARAHDSAQTQSVDPAPSLKYYGVLATAPSSSASPVASATPSPATVTPTGQTPGSGFPVGVVVIGVVVLGAAGVLTWYVLTRRGEQIDLVHPLVPADGVDLVHPFAPGVDVGPEPPQPPLPPLVPLPPDVPPPAPGPGGEEDTGTGTGEPDHTQTREGEGDGPPPPVIFGPRLPAGGATPATTSGPGTPYVPPPAQQATTRQRLTKHCGPQADDIFVDAVNRVRSRLITLFGTEPSFVEGYAFLAANGGALDFWVLNPATTCPGPHCTGTVTMCGRCWPQHILSDILYGFVGGFFDISEETIGAGGVGYQVVKWLGNRLGGVKGPLISPQHITEAQPAYAVGVRLGRSCRDPQHTGKWRVTKDDICAELQTLNIQSVLLKLATGDTASVDGCPPATCVNTAADTDWSRKEWSGSMPLDETQRWALTGKGL